MFRQNDSVADSFLCTGTEHEQTPTCSCTSC
uniref:Uncharacterized protein n=1 Tax=Anguilla anguilla TaxID=7936 RepID=A0A0E9X9P5_ANGAN